MEKIQDQERLATLIHQWNQDHYDIFELSRPNENLEFHGVVRFYFQDGANVVTKCIRVASTASTKEVVDVLIEKFRPDMRMLTRTSYALYEVHVNGDERRLLDNEKVLFVQLNWGKDVREGRFLLKQEGVPTISAMDKENTGAGKTFTRKLSKREKKEKKKQDKQKQKDHGGGLADKLYTDMPESKFTRSISNPEAVMKRRRQMKVEKKLQQCRGQDGQGGTLKIYGETLRPDIPYKTLLLSTGDDVEYVIKEALEKYDLDREDPSDFCLFQVLVPTGEREYHGGAIGQERVMEPHECPLGIAMRFPPSEGTVMFQLKRRPADSKKTKHKKIRAVSHEDLRPTKDTIPPHQLPYLVELNPDGSDNPKGKVCRLNMKFTEVGTDRNMLIQLHGPNVQPRHCVIGLTQSDGIVTITPTSPESETIVNNQRIQETTTLRHGMTLRFGKLNVFKFMDPHFEEKMRKGQMPMDFQQKRPGPQHPPHAKVHETNFDVDGKVESLGSSSPRGSDRGPEPMEVQQKRPPPSQTSPRDMVDGRPPPSRQEDALPAVLEFREDKEDGFLRSVILEINSSGTQFKLAPTYTSYMAVRYCISGGYRPDMSPHDRAHRVTGLVNKISHLVHQAVQNNRDNPVALALWMANASEILNFFKQDHDIHPFSLEAQEILAESVQLAFHHLVNCLQYDLQRTMTAFLDENDAADDDEVGDDRHRYAGKPTLGDVLDTLSSAMNLLRRCRVNAALTIQLFSQLFHYVNMWLFNVLVTEKRVQLCTRSWGMRLKRRLGRVEAWAEKQGLELAADCHLCRIIQAAHLLEAPKSSADDIANICSTCFKLNSLQLRELLQQYIPEPNEPPIPQNLIDQVVRVAENMEDEKIKSDGRDVRLEEDPDLQLPFLLPEDGYSCDTIRGIPNGLGEFVEPLSRAGVCRMVAQPGSTGEWTVYMNVDDGANIEQAIRKNQPNQPNQLQHGGSPPDQKPPMSKEPEVAVISFGKVKGSMGLSIVAAKGDNQKERGIYIKSVVTGGGADIDGRLQSGDQLLEVDGKSLVGLTQERAAELMTHTGQTVKLKVAKQGAFYHGLATQLSQPSPVMQRAATKKPSSPQATKHRPADEGPPPYTQDGMDRRHMPPGGHREQPPFDKRLQNAAHSRSSPALNNDGVGPGPERRGPPTSMPPSQPDRFQHRDPREIDPKSKSMANLRMEQPYDPRDPHQMMRPAASVGALQNAGQPINDYYNQGDRRNDPRGHDYENHQNLDTRLQKGPIDPTRNERNFPQNTIERQPPSSRTSNSSYREERPQSAYFGQQPERHDSRTDRPHSMEMNANKVHEWQQKYGMDPGQNSPHNHSFEHRDPNYMNTRPPVTAQQAGYVNQGDIPRLNANNESYQPNFYENTVPRQNGNSPAFQQLRGPGIEFDKSKSLPNVNKPHVAPKPISQKMPHVDIPKVEVDNRQTQPHFFDPRLQAADQRSPRTSQPNFSPSMTGIPTSTSYADAHSPMSRPIKKISPGREMYNTHRSPELPPPPQDIPPELPPPPAMDDLTEELPPLPPPPVQEYPGHGDPQYVNQGDARVNLNGPQPYHHPSFNPHQPTHMFQPPGRQDNPQRNVGITQPQRQQPTKGLVSQPPQRFQTNHDYQNITYDNKNQNRSFDSPHHQSPNHITYEQHDHRAQTLPGNMSGLQQNMIQQNQMLIQQGKVRIVQEMQDRTKDGKVGPSSPWDREEQEKQEKMKEEEVIRSRNEEIAFLEAKSYLSPQEQDRLRKLRFEQEFQRRVEEVASREDDDDDSDTEMTRTSHGREFLITSIRDDIHKAQKRMKDLETRQHFEEYEKEKDRMQRLERKLEIFERERQERQERLQKQQERKQREHDEYLRKQKKEQVDNLELREKQRQEYEANKRVHIQEAEKLQQRKEEELQRRKEMEREQLQRMQAQRDAEEAALRAEARRREEEYRREEMERQREKERQEQREIRVNEERKRLENMSNNSHTGYQPYANLPAQSQFEKGAPPPPQRGTSSYEMANQSFGNRSNIQTSVPTNNVNNYRGMSTSRSHPGPEISAPPGMIPKKSVSFNTQPDTHLYTPHGSQSSYRTSSVSSDTNNVSFEQNMPLQSQNDSVFNNSPQQNHVEAKYRTSENTPGVIGSQEIYRDPRNRIAAQKEANSKKGPGAERMSFRDKMKYFAAEAGENTPKEKPKASRTLRNIESQLHNGQ
ncbi:afadin-like isoform X5 [Mytilus californianus]|uniref:afadin-like isoform X5 n=1 Tax=Mytilus californianus TaxID=6549 RepID=UPI0022468A4C|nr:afadin-like isoform X5 [Mytilus californianus]